MKKIRRQLTIFLDEKESLSIEHIRRKLNPIQSRLIKSHITLCREDEIQNIEIVLNNLANLKCGVFELSLKKVKRFSDGKGVLIPVKDESQHFQKLRKTILKDAVLIPRDHKAHITLMHPRNSTCDDQKFEEIVNTTFPDKITVNKISLIEQKIGEKWKVLKAMELNTKEKILEQKKSTIILTI